jgi:hypothetical protein
MVKKQTAWIAGFAIALLALSVLLLGLHYVLFHDQHWLEKYVVFELAFLPLDVIVVTLILDRVLEARERKERLEKMNMVIGLFFSEVGTGFLREVAARDPKIGDLRDRLARAGDLPPAEFAQLKKTLAGIESSPALGREGLALLKGLLTSRRNFLVRLLENPILLEHEGFTDALRAVFHLTEEMEYRKSFEGLPESDIAHLTGDVKRAYGRLILEWLDYMRHLKVHYPYLYSLAMRTNPFDVKASPVVVAA